MHLTQNLLTLALPLIPLTHANVIDPSQTLSIPGVSSVYINPSSPGATEAARESINNNLGISSGIPDDTHADPCGPPSQPRLDAGADEASTCHQNVSVAHLNQASSYGVQCQNDNTGYILNQTTCAAAMATVCFQIAGMQGSVYQATDKWFYSTWKDNCTFGYWLPSGGAPPPSLDRCYEQIMEPMNEACTEEKGWNVGSVNLKELPGVAGTGLPVDGTYPSYVMIAQGSYFGVNSEDEAVGEECRAQAGGEGAVFDCSLGQ